MTEAGGYGSGRRSGQWPGSEGQDLELVTYGPREGAAQGHVERFSTLVERDDLERKLQDDVEHIPRHGLV